MTRSDGVMVPDDARARSRLEWGLGDKLELLESFARRPHRWKSCELRLREIEKFTQQAAPPPIGVDSAPRNVKPWLASASLPLACRRFRDDGLDH